MSTESSINTAKTPSTSTRRNLPPLPQSLVAFQDNWIENTASDEAFVIVNEEEFLNTNFRDVLSTTLKNMAIKMKRTLELHGEHATPCQIFKYLICRWSNTR